MSGAAKSAESTLVDVTPTAGRQTPGTADPNEGHPCRINTEPLVQY
jgi:hypothetical protein